MLKALLDDNFSMFDCLILYHKRDVEDLNRCLLLSAQKNNIKYLKTILECPDVDVNYIGNSRKTPAMMCGEYGNQESLNLLLNDSRCRINLQNSSGETALHWAVRGGNEKCVKELMNAGAKGHLLDKEGNTPLILASMTRYPNVAILKRLLEDKSSINIQNKEGRTALHYTSGQAMGTELLLKSGANPDIQDSEGNSPLHISAIEGFDNIMICFVAYNCNVNLINMFGRTPLHYIAMKGHWKMVDIVSQVGGLLDVSDKDGKTPLINAIENNRIRAVISLLKANCCPNAANETSGMSPLELCLDKKSYQVVILLLVFGANPSCLWKRVESDASIDSRLKTILYKVGTKGDDPTDLDESLLMISKCHSLQHLCRIKIREIMRKSKDFVLQLDQLSRHVRDYVLFKNVVFSTA